MSFSTGLSALRAHQTALAVVGHNIANASTEGYRRQEVVFVENPPTYYGTYSIGTGVSIEEIRSVGDQLLNDALTTNAASGGTLETQLANIRAIESNFLPGTGTIQEHLDDFFASLERLSGLPTDSTVRAAVVHSADQLSQEIRRVWNALEKIQSDAELEIEATIEDIDKKAGQLAKLNKQIFELSNTGKDVAGLENQRDLLIREMSALIDVQRHQDADGNPVYLIGGGAFSVDHGLEALQLKRNDAGNLEVWREGCDRPLHIEGGKLAGLLNQENGSFGIAQVRSYLEDFTQALVTTVDATHATGLGINGGLQNLTSGRSIEDTAAPLNTVTTVSPVQAGSLFVSVNNESTGETTVTEISFDPAADSLADLATRISGLDHLSSIVDGLGRITINAEHGFTYDFSGNPQTFPDTTAVTGTTVPKITGRFTGNENENFRLEFQETGTVGVSQDLTVAVYDQDNLIVRVLDVGQSYEPGSELVVAEGLSVSFAAGTANTGDSLEVQAVAQPDTTGILAAIGLNTLFVGNELGSLEVNPFIRDNPSLLATTTDGNPSDTRNLHRMIDIRDQAILQDNTLTLQQFLSELTANIGNEVQELEQDIASHEEHSAFLEGELAAASGVDVNEELAKMLQYQRGYQAAARYISTIDEVLQILYRITG